MNGAASAPSAAEALAGAASSATVPAARQLGNLLAGLLHPGTLAELAVLAGCFLLAWVVVKGLRRVLRIDGAVLFGRRLFDGVLFPVVALLLAFVAREVLGAWVTSAVFRVAIPVLVSLVVIRLIARVLAAALPGSRWAGVVEHTVSWVAWVAVLLWLSGLLPVMLAEMDGVRWKIGGAEVSLRNMVEGAISAGIVMVLALWLSSAIEKKLIRGSGDNLSLRMIAANLVRVVLLAVGVLLAMSAVGIDITALSVLGGAVGVGLGFGLQKIAANYVSGFVVLAERSLRIGDTVKIDNFEGRITDIRTRYTVIRAPSGREAIVPNEMLITQRVENSSLADPKVSMTSAVQVAYGTGLDALMPKLAAAMAAVPRVLAEPAPSVQLESFGADGMNLVLVFWIEDPHNGQGNVKSDINLAVLRCLTESGVEIPYPQRVLHGGTAPAAGPATPPRPRPGPDLQATADDDGV